MQMKSAVRETTSAQVDKQGVKSQSQPHSYGISQRGELMSESRLWTELAACMTELSTR